MQCAHADPSAARHAKNEFLSHSVATAYAERDIIVKRDKANIRKYGVRNVFQLASVKQKREVSLRRKYGDNWQVQLNDARELTNIARYGAKTPFQIHSMRRKANRTMIRKYGVPHAMQNPKVFEKAMRRSHKIDEHEYLGRRFKCQGSFEELAFRLLANTYGVRNVQTQFHKGYPKDIFSRCKTFPDFWIKSRDQYVEVKSTWTLFGNKEWWTANVKKAIRQVNADVNCRWVVIMPKCKPKYVKLPKDWYRMSFKQLQQLVNMEATHGTN